MLHKLVSAQDVRAKTNNLLRSVGVQDNDNIEAACGASFNTKNGHVQLSVTADIESDAKSAVIDDVKKRIYLSIMSPNLSQQSVPQDTSQPFKTSDHATHQEIPQMKTIEQLKEQNELLKGLCDMFESNGATLVDVQSGTIAFTLQIKSIKRLKSFWNAYRDDSLQSQIQQVLISEDLEQKAGSTLSLILYMDEGDYFQGLEFFGAQELRLVLVGRTGSGKSSTGNHILLMDKKGQRPFDADIGGTSKTAECNFYSNEVLGHHVVLMDTPGLFDTSLPNKDVLTQLTRFLYIIRPGPHAVILVIRARAVTPEIKQTVDLLVKLFQEGVYNYMIVLFTGKDDLDVENQSLEEFLEKMPSSISKIISKCGGRCIAFNNRASGEENIAQVGALLAIVDNMVQENGGLSYGTKLQRKLWELLPESEETSDPESYREAAKNVKLEPDSWFWNAVNTVAASMGFEKVK